MAKNSRNSRGGGWGPMEHIFSGFSFRNFGCTSRGWPKIPENSVSFDHSCSGLDSPSLEIEFSSSLIIHQAKTKEITSAKEVWIPGLN